MSFGGGFHGHWPKKVIRKKAANAPIMELERFVPRPSSPDKRALPKKPSEKLKEVFWVGPFYGLSGYSKANREIVARLADKHGFKVRIDYALPPPWHELSRKYSVNPFYGNEVSGNAPFVRFSSPAREDSQFGERHRIIFTMMETEYVHPDMVSAINETYHECWTPTAWNKKTFEVSGVKIPVHVMPLGVDTSVYRPLPKGKAPHCKLLTTQRSGIMEQPQGFKFLYVFFPTFRKGVDVVVKAFEKAFTKNDDVSLILAITHGSGLRSLYSLGVRETQLQPKIYELSGKYSEQEMARLYASCDAYVCASLGEGHNLPATEAACVGLPVIAPRSTSHPDLFKDGAWYFDPEGYAPRPGAEQISPWFKGMPFSTYGEKSISRLTEILREVKSGGAEVKKKALGLRNRISSEYTWDSAASRISERLLRI